MKIAFLCYEAFLTGGIRVYARELLNRIASLGHSVTLFAPQPPPGTTTGLDPAIELRAVTCARIPLFSSSIFGILLPGFVRKVEREEGRFDIIHSNTYADAFLPRLATGAVRITTVHHLGSSAARSMDLSFVDMLIHPSSEYGPALALEGFCLRRADQLVAVSDFTRNDIITKYPWVDPARIAVIYHGSSNRVGPTDLRSEAHLQKAWALGPEERILLCVGRLEARKGIPYLLKAISKLDPGTTPKLVLVGSGNSSHLERSARALRVSERVIFAGHVDDGILSALYAHASILVHPTSIEGFGLAVADAVDAGISVVATRVGSMPEIVREGVDGLLVDYGDSEGLADAISASLDGKSATSSAIRGSRSKRFSWDRTATETIALYERLLSMK